MGYKANTVFLVPNSFGIERAVEIPQFPKYKHKCLPENLNYVERFDGFGSYKEDEVETVGKIKFPYSGKMN